MTNIQACVNSHDFLAFFLHPRTNDVTTFIFVILNYHVKTCMYYLDFCQNSNKHGPDIGKFSREQFFKLRNIYLFKSQKRFINRSFVTNTACITSLFLKNNASNSSFEAKNTMSTSGRHFEFGRSTRCFVLIMTQANLIKEIPYPEYQSCEKCNHVNLTHSCIWNTYQLSLHLRKPILRLAYSHIYFGWFSSSITVV